MKLFTQNTVSFFEKWFAACQLSATNSPSDAIVSDSSCTSSIDRHQALPKSCDRRLAGILYADVAEYVQLTEQDEEGTHLHLVEAMKISRLRRKPCSNYLIMTTLAGLLAITSTVQADAVTGSFTNGDKTNVKNIKSSTKDGDAHIAMLKDGSTGAMITVNCAALKDADLVQGATNEMSVECQDPIIIGTPAGKGIANIPEKSLEAWQLGLINNPDDYMLKREAKGFVFIYDRLLDSQVDEILDNHFNRIDSMMFTRVKVTDSKGDIQIDPETGEELTEDDGCD